MYFKYEFQLHYLDFEYFPLLISDCML